MNTLEGVFHTEESAIAYAVELAIAFGEATWIKRASNGWEVWAGAKRP